MNKNNEADAEVEMKNFILAVEGGKPENIISPKLDSEEQDLISGNRANINN